MTTAASGSLELRLERALAIADTERRLIALSALYLEGRDLDSRLRTARVAAIRELVDDGRTWVDIGAILGVTPQRAQQIANPNNKR